MVIVEHSNKTEYYVGMDPFCEFGIESKVWKDMTIFTTWSTSLINLDPKFHVGLKIY